MARIAYPDVSALPLETREALRKIRGLNIFKLAAWADSLAPSFFAFVKAILANAGLDPKLRQIAILRVGYLCHSDYEVYQHEKLAKVVGLTDAQIAAIREKKNISALDERQRAVLVFAEEMVRDIKVTDSTFKRVQSFLPEKQLTELAIITSFYSGICRFLETMEVEIESKR